jgi:cysteine desulfurase
MNTGIKPLYFDYCATTPVDPRVMERLLPFLKEHFGNSISSLHAYGWEAERAVENARKQAAECLGTTPHEIYFTSGATESNNWVLQGLTSKLNRDSKTKIHILSSPVEHNSILKTLEHLKACDQIDYDLVPVNSSGIVSVEDVKKLIRPETKLMSFMWVNNELGSINPIEELGKLARENKIYFHSDATQAVGKIPVNLSTLPVDLLSFSGHKIYGPKGVGGLFIRNHSPKVQIDPLLFGGGHERSMRAGTLNVPGIVGLGTAMNLIFAAGTTEQEKLANLKMKYLHHWKELGLIFHLNGEGSKQAPHILNITFESKDPSPLQIPGIAYSRGSACQSGDAGITHVLAALKMTQTQANHTLRISFGRFTTDEDFQKLTKILLEKYKIH